MKGINQKRTLLVSAAVILLCMTIIVGMTYALFTDTTKLTNHLEAGDLKITLNRVALEKTALNEKGFLETTTVQKLGDTPVPFDKATKENVFGIVKNELIVPGSTYKATMEIANNSDVAFGYWIEIVCTNKKDGADLAKQVKVYVDADSQYVGNDLKVVGADGKYIGILGVKDSETFTVTVEFEDLAYDFDGSTLKSDNDAAQGEKLSFDLVVYAVQITKDPNP